MTYFGLIALPLVTIVILDDMRRYYMAENAVFIHAKSIDKIKMLELVIIAFTLLIIAIGFGKAIIKSINQHGKYFSFLAFFFGVPMGNKTTGRVETCNKRAINKIKREVGLSRKKPYTSNLEVTFKIFQGFAISAAALTIGYFTIYKNYAARIWNIYKNEYRNAKMGEGGIN